MHIWLLFTGLVLLPVFMFTSALFISYNYLPTDFPNLYRLIDWLNFWIVCCLILLAHIFFIATIVKYFKRKNEVTENETPAGLLDEFVS